MVQCSLSSRNQDRHLMLQRKVHHGQDKLFGYLNSRGKTSSHSSIIGTLASYPTKQHKRLTPLQPPLHLIIPLCSWKGRDAPLQCCLPSGFFQDSTSLIHSSWQGCSLV
ncbi:unnamed protein product [Eretmochelys imbricata]